MVRSTCGPSSSDSLTQVLCVHNIVFSSSLTRLIARVRLLNTFSATATKLSLWRAPHFSKALVLQTAVFVGNITHTDSCVYTPSVARAPKTVYSELIVSTCRISRYVEANKYKILYQHLKLARLHKHQFVARLHPDIINYVAPYTGVICPIIVRKNNRGQRGMQKRSRGEKTETQKEGEKDEEGRVRSCVME
jgi:hypothetical protein